MPNPKWKITPYNAAGEIIKRGATAINADSTQTEVFDKMGSAFYRCPKDAVAKIITSDAEGRPVYDWEAGEEPLPKPLPRANDKPIKKAKSMKQKHTIKPAKKTAASKKEKKPAKEKSDIATACNVNGGSLLEKILLFLEARVGKQVPESVIMKHLYGDDRKTNRMLHLAKNMKKAKGYRLEQEKDEKGVISYGLYRNGKNGNK